MALQGHIGCKFTLALRGSIETDRAVQVLVSSIAGSLGRRVAGFGDGAAVELARAMGTSDIGADDALQVIGCCRSCERSSSRQPDFVAFAAEEWAPSGIKPPGSRRDGGARETWRLRDPAD